MRHHWFGLALVITLVTHSHEKANGDPWNQLWQREVPGTIKRVQFTGGGRYLVVSGESDKTEDSSREAWTRVLTARSGDTRHVQPIASAVGADKSNAPILLRFGANGGFVNGLSGERVSKLHWPKDLSLTGGGPFAMNHDATRALTDWFHGGIAYWDVRAGRVIQSFDDPDPGHKPHVKHFWFVNGRPLIIRGGLRTDADVHVFALRRRKRMNTMMGHSDYLTSIDIMDGVAVSTDWAGQGIVWRIDDGNILHRFTVRGQGQTDCSTIGGKGELVVVGGHRDSVREPYLAGYDISGDIPRAIAMPKALHYRVFRLDLSRDAERLVTVELDKGAEHDPADDRSIIRVWDTSGLP